MKTIPRETRRVTYSTEIRNLKKIGFSEFEKAVVIGSILGDGCLCENWSKSNYRLLIDHSIQQKEYIFWKYSILKKWILSEPHYYERNKSLTIRTVSHPELTALWELFYKDKRKIIPNVISDLLKNPVALAVWFMDDGNAVMREGKCIGYHLNTQSFTYAENQLLAESLKNYYCVIPSIEINHGLYRLAIYKKESRENLKYAVEDFMVSSMKYKLG